MIETTKEHKLAILIPLDTVASLVYPARVRERVWNELLGSELWPVMISNANTYATDPKLAGNAGRTERAIVRIHNIKESVGEGNPNSRWLYTRCAHDRCLCWTITIDKSRNV